MIEICKLTARRFSRLQMISIGLRRLLTVLSPMMFLQMIGLLESLMAHTAFEWFIFYTGTAVTFQ